MEILTLWKIAVEAELDIDAVERAAAEVPEVTEATSPVRGVEPQRIDRVKGRSFVFFTGSDESARALEKCLKVAAKGAAVRGDKATARELYAAEPAGG